MNYKVTFKNNRREYSEIFDEVDQFLNTGTYTYPFPNEYGNSDAFGLNEYIMQSDCCPDFLRDGCSEITIDIL